MRQTVKSCVRCDQISNLTRREAERQGWRFHGNLHYCPDHKQFQFSMADRDWPPLRPDGWVYENNA